MERRNNADVLRETLDLPGKAVLDIGCGDGTMVRMMTRAGARVWGIECSERQRAKALAADKAGEETYADGVAQALEFSDATFDIVVFFNSLHHVPVEMMRKGLAEAARVLKPGGVIYINEPIADGPHFELSRPIDDETSVRAAAYRALKEAQRYGLREEAETFYLHTVRRGSFEEYREAMPAHAPDREAAFDAREADLRGAFERLSVKEDGAYLFDQPMRVNVLRKP